MSSDPHAGVPAIAEARQHSIGDLLRRTAQRLPEKLAVVHGDVRQTYRELNESVDRTANAIRERGVAKGDRVAILSRNSHSFVVAYFALAKLGAISVPINFMLTARDISYILGHSEATGMIVEPTLREVANEAIAASNRGMHVRASFGSPDGKWEEFGAWMDHPDPTEPKVAIRDDDPVQLLYTSGTESRPKGAMMTSRNLLAQYVTCVVDGEMTVDDIELHALPLYHAAQLHCFLTPDVYLGATNIILEAPDPTRLLEAVEKERATKLFCPPTVWIELLRSEEFDRRDLSSLRKGYYGAASMPVELLQELARRLSHVRLFNFYGQTEMAPLATILKPEDQLRKAGSAGLPGLNVETRLVDHEGRPVETGAVGEIVHRGPHAMLGYWRDPERTAEAYRDGWFHSGDLGSIDEDGYLTIVDRKKDMINSGGENVASREIEEVIYEHPGVAEVAVFGVAHPKWIEAVAAAVVPTTSGELSADEVEQHCRASLASYKVPKFIVIVDDLPKNPSGKILKRELRKAYEDLAERSRR